MARIELEDVAVAVDTASGPVTILAPVTRTLTERRIGLIGANGSGKSTLARLLNGLVTPTQGRVRIDDLDTAKDGAAVRRRVGFVFTDPDAQLVMPTAAEDVALSLRKSVRDKGVRHQRTLEILDHYGLGSLAEVSVHALSGGQKQLLALAGVLAAGPEVLVADEPTTLLDLRNRNRIADLLFELDQQVVLVTHDLELAARCDRVLVIDRAEVVFDGEAGDAVDHYRGLVT